MPVCSLFREIIQRTKSVLYNRQDIGNLNYSFRVSLPSCKNLLFNEGERDFSMYIIKKKFGSK